MAERVELEIVAKDEATPSLKKVDGALGDLEGTTKRAEDAFAAFGTTTKSMNIPLDVASALVSQTAKQVSRLGAAALRTVKPLALTKITFKDLGDAAFRLNAIFDIGSRVFSVFSGATSRVLAEVQKSTTAFAEQETATSQLAKAIRNTGGSYADLKGVIDRTIKTQRDATRFGTLESTKALQRLTLVTGDAELSIKNLSLVQDVAAGRNASLQESVDLVGKALLGNIGALGEVIPGAQELGRRLGQNATQAERSAAAMDLLTTSF